MTMQRTELEKTQLGETLTEVRSQEKAARKKIHELEEERAALVKQVYNWVARWRGKGDEAEGGGGVLSQAAAEWCQHTAADIKGGV